MSGATAKATRGYVTGRVEQGSVREHFREVEGLWMSSVGLGTYLGAADDETDEQYARAIVRAVELGCNVIDTAVNYRYQRSERAVGRALRELQQRGIGREQVVVATKGGFLPGDGEAPSSVETYAQERYFSPGILEPDELVGFAHAMTPRFIGHQLDESRANLQLETIDVYYLHNPETQLSELDTGAFERRLREVFETLEGAADEGKIRFYGTATWNAYRKAPDAPDALSLARVVELAREVGGEQHRFRFVQAPYNLAMTEALAGQTQVVRGESCSLLQAASTLGVHMMASASIAQGQLTQGLPHWLGTLFKGLGTDAQRSIQFVRSTPGLTTALVGMKSLEHVEENLALASVPPVPLEDFLKLFEVDEGE